MGEVYRAQDTKLGRQVAIKLLPEDMAEDDERLARFRREAKILASLNHPNIASIYQLEEDREYRFLVMELVEGKTLDSAVRSGGVDLETFFELMIPLTDAIAAAHAKGITHRDLKPANVLIAEDGRIKVLDFGIAKLHEDTEGGVVDETTQQLTNDGQIIGTVPYMSPEQIKGGDLDERSDLFSLGVLLYQLAAGEYPFEGTKSTELVASILRDRPRAVSEARPELPAQLGRIIDHCLEKDPKRRFQSALDLQNALEDLRKQVELGEATTSTAQPGKTPDHDSRAAGTAPTGWRRGLILGVVVALLAIGFGWWILGWEPGESADLVDSSDQPAQRPSLAQRRLSQLTFGSELEEWPAWSPDGQRIVYAAEREGMHRLFVQDLQDGEAKPLTTGNYDEIQPEWSPDASSIVFVRGRRANERLDRSDVRGYFSTEGDVWRVDLATGEAALFVEDAFNPVFSPDGAQMAVDAEWAGPLRIWATDARGRNPKQLSTDTSEAVIHTAPSWSPDGSKVVYRRIEQTLSNIYVTDTVTDTSYPVTDDEYLDLDPVWSPDGSFIYFSSYRGGGLNIWRIPVSSEGRPQGVAEQMTTGAGDDLQLTLSPDGRALAFAVLRLNSDLWTLPVDPDTGQAAGPAEALIATTREDSRGSWSADGTMLAFNSDRSGEMNLWLMDLTDGSSKQVTRGPGGDYQPQFSPDGGSLVFFSARAGNNDIWSLDLSNGQLTQLTSQAGLDMNPFYSPDGQWIAYQSDADGRLEVWLMRPDGADKRALTAFGASGHFLLWADDSKSLIVRSGSGSGSGMSRIDIETGQRSEHRPIYSGAHMSYSPNRELILDVIGHRTLLVYEVSGGDPREIFEFDNQDIHVDYPVWSPDGNRIVFDRAEPQGSDIWLLEGLN